MRDMNTSMGAPWWHYVGAMLIGWAGCLDVHLLTFKKISPHTGSPLKVISQLQKLLNHYNSSLFSKLSFNGLSPLRQKPDHFYPPPLPQKQESIFLKPVF